MNTTGITQRIIANSKRAAMLLLAMMLTATMAWAQDGTIGTGDDTGGNTPIGEGDTPGGDASTATPLTLEAIYDGTIMVITPKSGMQYSINGGTKTSMATLTTIRVTTGQKVQFYGNGKRIRSYSGTNIKCSVPCYIYGNIMSLVDEYNFATNVTLILPNAFQGLFSGNYYLQNHESNRLVLPATKLTNSC